MANKYVTMVRSDDTKFYTFAEVKYGKIVSINQHWVPLEEYKKFFEAGALFIDITDVTINGEPPAIGDTVNTGDNGYEIVHFKSVYSVAESKAYKIEMMKLERDRLELLPVEYNGNMFDADKDSLMRLDKARQSLEDNNLPSITWTTADNSRVDLTVADFKGINTAIAVRSNMLHIRYNVLKAYINSLEDKYLKIILAVNWDWDTEKNLDELMEELN